MRLASGSNVIFLGDIGAGSSKKAIWKVSVDGPLTGKEINMVAYGIVSGHLPEASWTGGHKSYPPYDYEDAIGGESYVGL
jgi:hypothetical protein